LNITYDWTYSTDYKGTLQRIKRSLNDLAASNTPLFTRTLDVKYIPTEDRIDIEKVKQREPILWYDEVNLYEDELHDHGISIMSIKVVRKISLLSLPSIIIITQYDLCGTVACDAFWFLRSRSILAAS
jgi:hypothetical protein